MSSVKYKSTLLIDNKTHSNLVNFKAMETGRNIKLTVKLLIKREEKEKDPIWLITVAHLQREHKTEQSAWTGIYKRAELGLFFWALVGTFPSITTVLTDRAFRRMPNS